MKIENLSGCGTALVTPFKSDLSIDKSALERLVQFQIAEGIDFLVPCGTTGESATLSADEQLRVVETVLEVANGRVPVIAGAGGNNTLRVIELARQYERMGVHGLLSVTPYYNKPTQEGIYQHFRAIAENTQLPIIIYNVPPRTAVNILPETAARLAQIPNIIGIKEASGDLSQIAELIYRAPSGFKVFSGDDALTLPIIALGGAGVISVASNQVPRKMTHLARAALEGRFEDARKLHAELFPLMKANFLETSPAPVKAALAMMGFIEEVYRLPLVPIRPETRQKLRAALIELKLIRSGETSA
jgi:4-hydroxy-tetrahydrodipicolinate synthase